MATMSPEVSALADPMMMADRWSMPSSIEGGFLLTDPLIGQRINTERPPIWVEDDALLKGGLAYLRRNAALLRITALFGDHQHSEDLGDPKKGWYEAQVKAADFYAYESFGYTKDRITLNLAIGSALLSQAVSSNQTPNLEYFLNRARGTKVPTFVTRVHAATTVINTPNFPIDFAADGTPAEQALYAAFEPFMHYPDRHLAGIAHLGFQNVREWIAVARTGVALSDKFGELVAPLRGFVTHGAEHRDLKRKFKLQGVKVDSKRLASFDDGGGYALDLSGMLSCGIVLPDEMPIVIYAADRVRDITHSLISK